MIEVIWLQQALDELATIWVQADSVVRQAITETAYVIDQELQSDPEGQGESRADGERVFFVYPLGIQFEVDAQRLVVRVLHVWDIRRRK
jgi:hypothetical protein